MLSNKASTFKKPTTIDRYDVYDVFYNDDYQYVIVGPQIKNYNINIKTNSFTDTLQLISCSHKHTNIYLSKKLPYFNNIDIYVDGSLIQSVKVNTYPILRDKILMSTLVKNEDRYIYQWVKYHLSIGVDHFVIYENSNRNSLTKILADYIKENKVTLIRWNYPYYYKESGISGQTTQQNHALYAFRNAKYIGLFDVDEYVNPQKHLKLKDIFDAEIGKNKADINNIGGFELISKCFVNTTNNSVKKFDFLKVYNCGDFILNERQKIFVIPQNVQIFSVHLIVLGKEKHTIDRGVVYFNHYIFLNKKDLSRFNNFLKSYPINAYDDTINRNIENILNVDKRWPFTEILGWIKKYLLG